MKTDIKAYSEELEKLLADPYISLELTEHKELTDTYSLKVNGYPGIGVKFSNIFYIILYNGTLYKVNLPKEEEEISSEILSDVKEKYKAGWNTNTIILYDPDTKEIREVVLPKPFKEYNKGIRAMKMKSLTKGNNLQVLNREEIMEF